MMVILDNRRMDQNRILGNYGGPRRRRGTMVADAPPPRKTLILPSGWFAIFERS
jgi:hypothetical protein